MTPRGQGKIEPGTEQCDWMRLFEEEHIWRYTGLHILWKRMNEVSIFLKCDLYSSHWDYDAHICIMRKVLIATEYNISVVMLIKRYGP